MQRESLITQLQNEINNLRSDSTLKVNRSFIFINYLIYYYLFLFDVFFSFFHMAISIVPVNLVAPASEREECGL